MTRVEFLERCGGILLDFDGVARLLPRATPKSVKCGFYRQNELGQLLLPHKRRFGRRIYFSAEGVGLALGLYTPDPGQEVQP